MVDQQGMRCRLRLCFANPEPETIKRGVAVLADVCRREFGAAAQLNVEKAWGEPHVLPQLRGGARLTGAEVQPQTCPRPSPYDGDTSSAPLAGRLSIAGPGDHHPHHAETVGHHAEARGEEGLGERLQNLTALADGAEDLSASASFAALRVRPNPWKDGLPAQWPSEAMRSAYHRS